MKKIATSVGVLKGSHSPFFILVFNINERLNSFLFIIFILFGAELSCLRYNNLSLNKSKSYQIVFLYITVYIFFVEVLF